MDDFTSRLLLTAAAKLRRPTDLSLPDINELIRSCEEEAMRCKIGMLQPLSKTELYLGRKHAAVRGIQDQVDD